MTTQQRPNPAAIPPSMGQDLPLLPVADHGRVRIGYAPTVDQQAWQYCSRIFIEIREADLEEKRRPEFSSYSGHYAALEKQWLFTADQMHAYLIADRAARAQAVVAQPEPVAEIAGGDCTYHVKLLPAGMVGSGLPAGTKLYATLPPQSPAPRPVAAALDEERRKFQQETRRTSELATLLRKWVSRHEREHGPGPWAKGCELCALVGESNALMARPINAPAQPWGTGLLAREELANDGHVGAGPSADAELQSADKDFAFLRFPEMYGTTAAPQAERAAGVEEVSERLRTLAHNVDEMCRLALRIPNMPWADPHAHSLDTYARAIHQSYCELRFKLRDIRKEANSVQVPAALATQQASRMTMPAKAEVDMVLVPREPTEAMQQAGYEGRNHGESIRSVWAAMIAAAPCGSQDSKGDAK